MDDVEVPSWRRRALFEDGSVGHETERMKLRIMTQALVE
jgi:hypothetical protein